MGHAKDDGSGYDGRAACGSPYGHDSPSHVYGAGYNFDGRGPHATAAGAFDAGPHPGHG